jgi:nucleotide-binding universal stress UspA family protein
MNEMYRITRILVPVDGSDFSRYAAEHAVRLARTYAAEVVFLHVLDEQIISEIGQQQGLDGEERTHERLLDHGEGCLRNVARLAEEHGVAHREVVAEGDPCAVICETAKRERVDIIVVGRIGRTGARRILMGSITRRLIESTDRPVLVVTAPPGPETVQQQEG